jgi:endonuclease YncB( thermonuclease family)
MKKFNSQPTLILILLVLFAITIVSCSRIGSIGTSFSKLPSPTPILTQPPHPTNTPASSSTQCIPHTEYETGTVTKIIDGDTIRVDINTKNYPVRLIGINAPELSSDSPSIQAGINYLEDLILFEEVALFKDQSETDKFDRLLRYVPFENTLLNYELVRSGFAKSVSYYPDTACNPTFNEAQIYAKNNLLGIWSPVETPASP